MCRLYESGKNKIPVVALRTIYDGVDNSNKQNATRWRVLIVVEVSKIVKLLN